MPKESTMKYIEQLTWLRGIAAFFVIVSHSLRATEGKYLVGDEPFDWSILSVFDLGSFGVTLFFVLSGCTLYISNADKMHTGNVHTFYIKRVFRIWPAYLVSLLTYILFGFLFSALYPDLTGNWIQRQFMADYSLGDVVNYIFLVFNIFGPTGLFNNAYWSLPVEFQYYLVFPLLVLLIRYTGYIGPLIVGVLLYSVPKTGVLDDVSFGVLDNVGYRVFQLAFTFCGGVVIGWYYKRSSLRLAAGTSAIILTVIVLLAASIVNKIIVIPDLPVISNLDNWYGLLAIVAVAVVLFTEFDFHNRLERFLKYYGTISYSTYLYHNIFVAVAVLMLIEFEIHDASLRLYSIFIFTTVMSYFVAGLSFRFVEKPFITLGRKFVNHRMLSVK